MTDNPHLTSAHTPPFLPTITTASHVGSISTPNLSVSDVFCVPKLHLNLLFVGQIIELGLVICTKRLPGACEAYSKWQIEKSSSGAANLTGYVVLRYQICSFFVKKKKKKPIMNSS